MLVGIECTDSHFFLISGDVGDIGILSHPIEKIRIFVKRL